MLSKLPDEDCFYFVHSYRAIPDCASDVVGTVDYGGEFAAAVAREGMFAVQFHPEKSQGAGHRLLDAFAYPTFFVEPLASAESASRACWC